MVLVLSCDLTRPHDQRPGHTPTKFRGHRHHTRGNIILLLCHVTLQGQVTKGSSIIMGLIIIKLLMAIPHSAKLGCHKQCGSGDIIAVVFHVILHDYVFKESLDFTCRSPSM